MRTARQARIRDPRDQRVAGQKLGHRLRVLDVALHAQR